MINRKTHLPHVYRKDYTYSQHSCSQKSKRNLKRKIMKVIRATNDNILYDNLWRGRFYARCDGMFYNTYNDGSGTFCGVAVTFVDLAIEKTYQAHFDDLDFTMFNGATFWRAMNDFIVDYCEVWNDKDFDPRFDHRVYRTR